MKRITALPLVLGALAACAEAPFGPAGPSLPGSPNAQLISGGVTTTTAENAATVYGNFTVEIGGSGTIVRESGPGINDEGKEIGTCGAAGRWTNPAGNTAGAIPHSHCVTSTAQVYTLEDIPVRQYHTSTGRDRNVTHRSLIEFSEDNTKKVVFNSSSDKTLGDGIIEAYALMGGARAGKFVFDLNDYDQDGVNLVDGHCYVGNADPVPEYVDTNTPGYADCLDRAVTAKFFTDLNADPATATPVATVTGYLLWRKS